MKYFFFILIGAWVSLEAHSYVLLTANMDDVHNMAKQIVRPDVANKAVEIWNRARKQFNQHVASPIRKRYGDEDDDIVSGDDRTKHFLDDDVLEDNVRRVVRIVKGAIQSLNF